MLHSLVLFVTKQPQKLALAFSSGYWIQCHTNEQCNRFTQIIVQIKAGILYDFLILWGFKHSTFTYID